MRRFKEPLSTNTDGIRKNQSTNDDLFESALFAADLGGSPTLDLHGFLPMEAIDRLDAFLNHEAINGTEAVRIIHGRGHGKLREHIHTHLRSMNAIVASFRDSQAPAQAGGVTLVALHRIGR